MRNFCTILLVVLVHWAGFAGEDGWYQGEVVFNSEATLGGEVRYDWRAGVVQYRRDGRVQAFGPHLLQSFAFFDVQLNTIRRFQALSSGGEGRQPGKTFFEVVLNGPLKLVRRASPTIGFGVPAGLLPAEDADLAFQLSGYSYFVHTGSCLVSISRFRRELWPAMAARFGPELKQFMKRYGVSRHTLPGKLRLINQFNVLEDSRALATRG
ncbi:MAG: hypothetical protein ICV83_33750 [Cytophagales bacterium]|nr:hypothetical protein [Cytophagales bacterium]